MAYTRNNNYRYISNKRINSKYRQFLALVGVIVIGMIISAAINAIPSSKNKSATKSSVHMSTQVK